MTETKNVHALAGLFVDPRMKDQIQNILPSQWMSVVESTLQIALQAGNLAAGKAMNPEAPKAKSDQPLQSVFSTIQYEGSLAKPVFWPQVPLSLNGNKEKKEETIFPRPSVEPSSQLWADFLSAAAQLKAIYEGAEDSSMAGYIENLLSLMQRFTWCLPVSNNASLPDVSLYDQSRMTSALASALASKQDSNSVALLVGGDLSGVQKFIYTISARRATSALRGRSFYLQMLTEVSARYMLRKLGLPITSLIYAGGGNFFFLAPPDADLSALREHISRVLLHHHQGDLYLAVESIPLKQEDFFQGAISKRWQELTEKLNKAKQQAFSELGDGLSEIFLPQGHGGNEEAQCQVCGLEHPQTSRTEPRKCPPCTSYEELGRDLRNARYLTFTQIAETQITNSQNGISGKWHEILAHFGMRVTPSEFMPQVGADSNSLILALDDDGVKKLQPSVNCATGRRLLVNVTPLVKEEELKGIPDGTFEEDPEPGDVKPFDLMQFQAQGIKRLGVMRMDVDNMSKVISEGFGENATLSRLGALSFAVSLFFEGWVGKLAKSANDTDQDKGWGQRLYSIYSGGDDLFFVGSWDAVVELARQIRADLSRFTGHHPGIHASAGIVLVGGKYPLYQAAQDAGAAEERAKNHVWVDEAGGERKKDTLDFLGQTIPWARFGTHSCEDLSQPTVHAWAHRLQDSKESPAALLRQLMQLQEQYDEEFGKQRKRGADVNIERRRQSLWGPWNWLGEYFLKRMRKRAKEESFRAMLDEILRLFQNDQFASIQWIGSAARWAELKLKKAHNSIGGRS